MAEEEAHGRPFATAQEGQPISRHRWRRKCETGLATDGWSPVPTQIVSNEEYRPLPPTPAQQAVAHRLRETSRLHAKTLGMTRWQFLSSACGMAAAFLVMNEVFGDFFDVDPVEAWEVAAAAERRPPGQFIFDVQAHHVAAPRQFPYLLQLRSVARRFNPDVGDSRRMEELYLENYVKEVFLDGQHSAPRQDGTLTKWSGRPRISKSRRGKGIRVT